jgi:hypothetical protein
VQAVANREGEVYLEGWEEPPSKKHRCPPYSTVLDQDIVASKIPTASTDPTLASLKAKSA